MHKTDRWVWPGVLDTLARDADNRTTNAKNIKASVGPGSTAVRLHNT